jgi:hypothetical protein
MGELGNKRKLVEHGLCYLEEGAQRTKSASPLGGQSGSE